MKENMKKILGSFIFLALAVGMFMVASYILRPTGSGMSRGRFSGFYAEEENSLSIVAFGSSAVYNYINNPFLWEEFGITEYNLATGSQPTYALPYLLKEVEKTQSPQLYVIEVRQFLTDEVLIADEMEDEESVEESLEEDSEDLSEEEDENSTTGSMKMSEVKLRRMTDNMDYSWNRTAMINEQVPMRDRLDYYFDIIRYHGNWEQINFAKIKYYDNAKPHAMKGWFNNFKIMPMEPNVTYTEIEPLAIPQKNEEDLIEVLELCKENDWEVIFLASPWQTKENNIRKTKYVQNIVEEYGFNFFDGNQYVDEMGIDFQTDFFNKKHLNAWGSEKFTRYFVTYLLENYEFDTDYSESVVRSWDKAAEKYRKEVVKFEETGEK